MQIQRTPHGFDCRAATTPDGLRSAGLPSAWLRPRSCAKIECLASDEKKGWVYLGVTTPKDSIEIYKSASTSQGDLFARRALRAMLTPRITKSGKMRVYNAKDSTNKKEML